MKIRNVSGEDRVIPATGDFVEAGHQVDVPDELGGRPPEGEPTDEDFDPGEGLLAQPDNWKPAAQRKAEKADKAEGADA